MKCYITITGQPSGNFNLRNKIGSRSIETKKGRFNGFHLVYDKISDAKKDLKEAYKAIKKEEPDYQDFGLGYNNESLYYDASRAELIKN